MNKGINMAQGRYAIFLNSGDVFHEDVALFARQLARQKEDAMFIGDALLDFGEGKSAARCETGLVYLPQPPGQPSGYFLPNERSENSLTICAIKCHQIMLAASLYKSGYPFRRIKGLVSEFSMGGVSTSNNLELCRCENVQRKILRVPGFWAELSYFLRLKTTGKAKALYNKA